MFNNVNSACTDVSSGLTRGTASNGKKKKKNGELSKLMTCVILFKCKTYCGRRRRLGHGGIGRGSEPKYIVASALAHRRAADETATDQREAVVRRPDRKTDAAPLFCVYRFKIFNWEKRAKTSNIGWIYWLEKKGHCKEHQNMTILISINTFLCRGKWLKCQCMRVRCTCC